MIGLEPGEEIRPIEGFPNYWVTSFGRVISGPNSSHRAYIQLSPGIDKNGYTYISLSKGGKVCSKRVATIVGQTFIPNPEGKRTVNHIKGEQKWNNRVDNLEWSTGAEQIDHALSTGLIPLRSDWGIDDRRKDNLKKPYRLRVSIPGVKKVSLYFLTKKEALSERDRICLEHGLTRPC